MFANNSTGKCSKLRIDIPNSFKMGGRSGSTPEVQSELGTEKGSEVCAMLREFLNPSPTIENMENMDVGVGVSDAQLSDTDMVATHLARHMIQSIQSISRFSSPKLDIPSSASASAIDGSHSQLAQSLAQKILVNLESSASPHSEQAEQAEDGCIDVPVLEGDWNPASNVSTGHSAVPSDAAIDMAKGVIFGASSHSAVPAHSDAASQGQLSQNTDSVVAESITRNLIVGGMCDSDVRSQSGHIPEEALSDGYAVNGVAREVIVSAAAQEVPTQRTAPSSHIESEGAVSHAVQLVARDTFAEHATVPYASSLPKDLVEQPRSDADGGAEVQAILRQTIDGACSGTSAQSKIPPSQQESEHADSMVAGSAARQIIAPHAAAGSNSRDVEEQVHSEAEVYVDAVEQAVAREFVASASNLQGVPQPSHEQLSQKTDSVVPESITRNLIAGGMYESDVRSQSGHIPEEALSDGYAVNGVAREVIVSAAAQEVPTQRTAPSSHIESEGAVSHAVQLVARDTFAEHATVPYASSLPKDPVEQPRSDADGGAEVQAILRQTIDGACSGMSAQSKIPPSQQESEHADSMVAGSVARQIIAPHAAAGSNSRDVEEQVHSEAEGYVDAVEQAVAREFVASASNLQGVPQPSHEQLSQKTDSVVPESITRNLIVGGMYESDVRSQSGHIPEEALSDGYAVNGVAREVIVSAAAQEVPTQRTAPSSHIESEGAVSHAVQLVARDTFAEHATVPYASSLPKDLVEQPRSDADGGAEVQAILRQTIDGACSGTSAQSKIPPSQQESEHADSMVAGSVARQIIAPHAAAGSNSRDVEEQVHSEAEGYVDAVEQAVAREFVASASNLQGVPQPSHEQLSQKTDSVVPESITRNLIAGGMYESDVRSQSGHIPEEALSDGYAVNGVAREVIVSAAAQEVPTQRTAPSSHIESEGAVSHAVQLVARDTFAEHATVPYASSLPKDLVEQPRSDADGGAEVQAILRQTIDGACSGTSAQSKIPPSQQESEHADSMVAGSVARQIIAPHAAAGSNSRDVEEQVHSEAEGYVDAVEQAVAREFVASASNLQGVPQPSHEQLSQKTDSVVPESITRNLIVGGMYESDVRSQSGHIPEEALSDGYAVNGVAREVIVSAAAQEVPTQRTAPSSHIESEGAVSHAVQLVARDTFAEHATVPYASSLPKDLVEQPRSDADGGAEVQAILRQTIDGACSGTSAQSKIPPSQQESEHADSMVAGSVARQIIAPHAAAGSNSRDVEEQVHSEAEGYVDAVEQAVAREFVASASDLQHVPRTNPSSEVCSEKTDSAVAQSLAKEATLPYVLE